MLLEAYLDGEKEKEKKYGKLSSTTNSTCKIKCLCTNNTFLNFLIYPYIYSDFLFSMGFLSWFFLLRVINKSGRIL